MSSPAMTLDHHRITLNHLCEFAGKELLVSELSDELTAGFMRSKLAAGMEASTVNGHRGNIQAWWRFAKRRGLIDTLPDVPKLKVCLREPDALEPAEVGALLDAAACLRGLISVIPAPDWFRAMVALTYYTALRRGALLGLRVEDVDWKTGILTVPPKVMKNRRGKKFILPAQCMELLKPIELPPRKMLFPFHWTNHRCLYLRIRKAMKVAGVKDGVGRKLHLLRRTAATQAAIKGGIHAAMVLLGHSEEYVTNRYIDPTKIPGTDISALLPPIPMAKGGAT